MAKLKRVYLKGDTIKLLEKEAKKVNGKEETISKVISRLVRE